MQPGVIGGHVNSRLRPYGAKMGPDPASINACMMGGILSNNSSGMCCGVAQNAYHTLESLTFVLPSGTVINTADPDADEDFPRAASRAWPKACWSCGAKILARPALRDRIRAKYRTKNTTGYSLNAFIDFERPVDIFSHVLIGSEGTLAFIAGGGAEHGSRPAREIHRAAAVSRSARPPAPPSCRCATRARGRLRSWTAPRCARWRTRPGIPPSIKKLPAKARPACWWNSRRERSRSRSSWNPWRASGRATN